ncbi:MAG: VWA domain-containing protein [Deltaproteobacteria bacterium]|nr:VWA domain-containing protein [Deltaproteobacteria bacterium]
MSKLIFANTIWIFTILFLVGCGNSGNKAEADGGGLGDGGVSGDSDADMDTDSDGDSDTDTDGDTDTDADSDSDPDGGQDDICGEQGLELQLAGVNVMLLVDHSGSMLDDNKWAAARGAIKKLVEDPAHVDTWFGLHPFPGPLFSADPPFIGICEPYKNPQVALGPDQGSKILGWLGNIANNPILGGLATPMLKSIQYYLGAFTTPLHDAETSNYLVLLSDGADTCSWAWDDWGNPNILAGMTDDLKDVSGIKTIAVGLGSDVSESELDAVAKNGGSTFETHIAAADATELESAFNEIAQSIRPCRFLIEAPQTGWDSSKVNFYFDGVLVDRDRKHQDGWDWTKSDLLEVEFHGPKCIEIQDNSVSSIEAKFGCPTQIDGDVCATHDAYLPFPDVAVLILLDSSGSMGDGDKWRDSTTAITNMLVDDRNNRIEFGFDPFPDGLGCNVALSPKFTVGGQLNHLPIIDWGASQNPDLMFGSTPLLAVMKRLINRPGRIADHDVSGSVVLISDGADTCYDPHDQVPAELKSTVEEAVSRHGIRVFAIGFGDLGQDAQDQLNAIAEAGDTGVTTYMEASNQQDLDDLFKQISSMVTSCIFTVPYAGANADYDQVNFYFDGEVVPRDDSHQDGWDWLNDVNKDKIEFFGSYCDKLKSGDVTDVVVEFGCETTTVV